MQFLIKIFNEFSCRQKTFTINVRLVCYTLSDHYYINNL